MIYSSNLSSSVLELGHSFFTTLITIPSSPHLSKSQALNPSLVSPAIYVLKKTLVDNCSFFHDSILLLLSLLLKTHLPNPNNETHLSILKTHFPSFNLPFSPRPFCKRKKRGRGQVSPDSANLTDFDELGLSPRVKSRFSSQ